MPVITIKDIAKQAGVSVATVSYVINKSRFVSPELTGRVLEAIEAMGYSPNDIARSLRQKSTKMIGLIVPLLGGLAAVMGVVLLFTVVFGRKASFKGSYGMLGGTVCPRCALPYSLSLFAPRLLVGRLQRCPHCGKWALVRRARPDELAAAEARWRGDAAGQESSDSAGKRAQRQIDDSRYVE